ncbi:MAG: Coenzyme F420 hydrogenase/dehydrogenase, beta subunit C-terminal domain [Candidatus Thorarchaeota archaeon]
MKIKTFQDLIEEVHKPGICQQCGGCVSFCNSIENKVIGFKEPISPPVYLNREKCLECGICYLICPQTHTLDEDLNKTYKFSTFSLMPLGFTDNIYSCQALDKDFLNYGTDGGVVNSIINYLIEKRIIEGAIVANTRAAFSRNAILAKSKEDLINASGAKLDISLQLDGLQKFHTYTRSLPKLRHYKFKKLALVGTPCQIYTIRCMQSLGIIPSENIEICLGLFCYENFFFDQIKANQFEEEFNIKFDDIEKINLRESLIIKLKDKITDQGIIKIPFEKLTNYMRPACAVCYDFTNVYADISFGGLASPDKYTTVISRTKKGRNIINSTLKAGIIKALKLDLTTKIEMKEKITQLSHMKIMRSEINMRKQLKSRSFSSMASN